MKDVHDFEAAIYETLHHLLQGETAEHAHLAHVATEDAVIHALESGQRLGLPEPVRSVVAAILDAPATNRGTLVDELVIDDDDPARMCVTVQLHDGSLVPLVVCVAAE
jgi:hypothetical protein